GGGSTGGDAGGGSGTSQFPSFDPGTPGSGPAAPAQATASPAVSASASSPTGGSGPTRGGSPSDSLTPPSHQELAKEFTKASPLIFESNRGQTDAQVAFLSRGAGYGLFITNNKVVLGLAKPNPGPSLGVARKSAAPRGQDIDVLAVSFVGANAAARATGQDELSSRSNYFIGASPLIDIPNFSKVQLANLWTGVDSEFYSNQQGQLEFDFVVAPGTSPLAVQMDLQGASNLTIDAGGNLLLDT